MIGMAFGQRAPQLVGATEGGRFYSLDIQAGRPAVLLFLHGCAPEAAAALLIALEPARGALDAAGIDLTPLAPQHVSYALAFAETAHREAVIYANPWPALPTAGAWAVVVDRAGRIVHQGPVEGADDLLLVVAFTSPLLTSEPARRCVSSAPALILPNVLAPEDCRGIIERFEQAEHKAGVMAGFKDGQAIVKLDESKKRRREIELKMGSPDHNLILNALTRCCVPEIKRAFQVDIAHADRILVARYDDTGGYFKRHRDDAAPQTAFREFAISLNLNTDEYEGGELLFPEFDDNRYSPPAGGAVIFSASLLHEAAPVTRGSRYVVLSFLCSARGAQRMAVPAS